jgi:hypothetical protein
MKKAKYIIASLICIFSLYALWNAYNPPFESPDEQNHVEYVHYLATHKHMPKVEAVGFHEYHQPPLYYVLLAPVYDLFIGTNDLTQGLTHNWVKGQNKEWKHIEHHDGTWKHYNRAYEMKRTPLFTLRLFSSLITIGTLIIAYLMTSIFFNKGSLLKYAIVFFIGLIPQFSFISNAVNNDNLAVFVSTLTIFVMLLAIRDDKYTLPLGILLGIGYYAKATDYFLVPFIFLCVLMFSKLDLKAKVVKLSVIFAVLLLMIAPYSIYLYVTYGDPFGRNMLAIAFRYFKSYPAVTLATVNSTIGHIFDSFWAWFGWLSVRLPGWFYNLVTLFVLFAIIGLFRPKEKYNVYEKMLALAFFLELIYFISIHFVYGIYVSSDQGRYLYVVIYPICYFLLKGFMNILSPLKIKDNYYYLSIIFIMISLNIYSLLTMAMGLN